MKRNGVEIPEMAGDGGEAGIAPGAGRLPAATTLGRVCLQVADLGRSLAFYEGGLGFRVLSRAAASAVLGAHGDDAALIELHERRGALPAGRRALLGLFHVAILLPDRAALGRFLAHVARLDLPLGASDHLVSEALYLSDPDGLGLEVYADRPRHAWRRRGPELEMATLALDAPGVMAAGRDEPWTGMPAGTRVGHVHLHVGDLDTAAEFYHAALGLDAMVWSYPGALFLAAGGYHHHLGLNTWAGPHAEPPGAEHARLLEWEMLLPDADAVEAAARRFTGAGVAVLRANDALVVADPWGTVLRLAQAPATP